MEISINVHVQEGPPLRFSGMDHGADCKSVVIGGDGYPDVTFFLNREHAIQIRDHFAALVEAWEPPETWPCNDCGQPCLKGDELCGPCYENQRGRDNPEPDSLRTLGLSEADFR